jgi:hexosaminidase
LISTKGKRNVPRIAPRSRSTVNAVQKNNLKNNQQLNYLSSQNHGSVKYLFTFFILAFVCLDTLAQEISIIPQPASLQVKTGAFDLTPSTTISIPAKNQDVARIGTYLTERIKSASGFQLKVIEGQQSAAIQLKLGSVDPKLGKEGYLLEVTDKVVTITAAHPAGIFYGVQTLLQLLPNEIESKNVITDVQWRIPAVSITDYPRFPWRGIMLDVSRHFFPKEFVKEYIDQIARYKFNRFHFHLTDDQGWRIEIKSYPKLTDVGAWRVPRVGTFGQHEPPKPGEPRTDGGFYTQEDIKEIVQYAKDRYVEILPEIDVPGHSMAAIAAYPELCVTKDTSIQVNPGTRFSKWFGGGKFEMLIDNTLNPTDEKVYQFLDKVFGEVAQLFPFEYIHIGGDECYKGYWEKDPNVQAFMKKNRLKDGVELQSYFTKRVSKIIGSKKKKTIGWDEILEGGIAADAAVMSWRGVKGGIEASHLKHTVVMSPNPQYYLDMNQGEQSVEHPIYDVARIKDVYAFDILAPGIDSAYVVGGQGNLWTETVSTPSQAEYMTYPRAFAISETLWSPKSRKNWSQFVIRMEDHFQRFDFAKRNYAESVYDPVISVKKNDEGNLVIKIEPQIHGLDIHYTLDNNIPDQYSARYGSEIVFTPDVDQLRLATFRNGKQIGRLISLRIDELQRRVKK